MNRRALFAAAGAWFVGEQTASAVAPIYVRECEGTWMGVPDGKLTAFRLTYAPVTNVRLEVFLNGLLQREGATYDYTYSAKFVTFNHPPSVGDFVTVQYYTQ